MSDFDFIKTVLPAFTDDARMQKRGFFSTFFKTRPEYYTNSEFIEIDVKRGGVKVAPVLRDRRTGSVIVRTDDWKANRFRPPYSSMSNPIDLSELMQRQFGEDDVGRRIPVLSGGASVSSVGDWYGRLANKVVETLSDYHQMFLLQMELQCAQVMQSGKLVLKNEDGQDAFELDFGMKETHKPVVSIDWSDENADVLGDIEALADCVNDDGLSTPTVLVFGKNAWNNAMKNKAFKELFNKEGYNLGVLTPGLRENGGRYQGHLNIGSYGFELYTYNGSYELLNDSTRYKFLDEDKVICTASNDDLDFRLVFGGVPSLGMAEPFSKVVPATVTYPDSIRVHNRVYEDVKNDSFTAESKMRGIAVPVSIDRFGCLMTKIN